MRITPRIIGHGMTPLGKLGLTATELMASALHRALASSTLTLQDIDGLLAIPSLSEPRFMQGHHLATAVGLLPSRAETSVVTQTIDTGGAGPVSALLAAAAMVRMGRCKAVAVVAGDAVSSLNAAEFIRRADATIQPADAAAATPLPSPVIPHGYDRVAQWHVAHQGVTREQLAMCSVIMSRQASRHPLACTRRPRTLSEVLAAPAVAPMTGLYECARRADGGAAIIVASSAFLEKRRAKHSERPPSCDVEVMGGGEASGPLPLSTTIDECMFSCEPAARLAYLEAGVLPSDIQWFGLYDCFPICFVRAVEAVGLAGRGEGGAWVEDKYRRTMDAHYPASTLPVNTHGGLMAFGAPWEVPSMYNIIEACEQLSGSAGSGRQVADARRALVYGNGGIFSHSAVAILSASS